jgi:Rod binding domain-containing protein
MMSKIAGTASAVIAAGAERTRSDPPKVVEAARQFEALLLSQMLKSVREAESGGWLGSGGDGAGDCAMSVAEEQLAQVLSSNGGLGIANLVVVGLADRSQNGAADYKVQP